ncbi:syntaxin-binding protein 4 [Neosynchiropus ocellatus]
MPLLTRDIERFNGLSLLYWTIMGPHGINRAVQRLEFCDCRRGLGVKIIGGHRQLTGEDFGIYIKRVIGGGLAELDGRLRAGDLILEVNDTSLVGVTNERAVEILRSASLSNHMSLLVARDDDSRREFYELMDKYGGNCSTLGLQMSPAQQCAGKQAGILSSDSPQLVTPENGVTPTSSSYISHSSSLAPRDGIIQLICVAKATGLGLVIGGGANRPNGPMVFVQEIMVGGDCQKDGRLQVGDQIISINKESLIGVTYEEARGILTRTRLRSDQPDPTVEVAFVRRRSSSSSSGPHSPSGGVRLQGKLMGPGSSCTPPGLIPRITSSLNQTSETLPAVDVQVSPVKIRDSHKNPAKEPEGGTNPDGPEPQSRKSPAGSSGHLTPDQLGQAVDLPGLGLRESQQQMFKSQLPVERVGNASSADLERFAQGLVISQLKEGPELTTNDPTCVPKEPQVRGTKTEMEKLRKEHCEALKEVKRLQEQLKESQRIFLQMEEEVTNAKQKAEQAEEETQTLRSELQQVHEVQREARGMEMDYEEVVHLLEAEIAELKAQKVEATTNQHGWEELKRKIAVLECQLRKSEDRQKNLQSSTAKLLAFIENVQNFLQEAGESGRSFSPVETKAAASTSYKKPWASASLVQEAKELTRAVRAVLDMDCLPHGWEEAYTDQGIKYYINHLTQTTSWTLNETSVAPSIASDLGSEQEGAERVRLPGSSIETEM